MLTLTAILVDGVIYASWLFIVADGRILADGTTAQVLADFEVRKYVIGSEIHRAKT